MLGTDIAIDLGTSTVKIYLDGKGVILKEPAVVAYNVETEEVVAIGSEAYAMVGRTSDRIDVVQPLCNGVISDFDLAQYLISHYMKQISGSKVFMPRVVVSVPCLITEVEKRAVVNAISSAGVRKICLIEEPVAAAMGAGVKIDEPHGTLIVDIGGGTTDMGVLSLSGIAISRSIKTAGNAFDEAIIKYVRRKYNLIIGKRMAEEAKIAIGCVYPRKEMVKHRVKGRNDDRPAAVGGHFVRRDVGSFDRACDADHLYRTGDAGKDASGADGGCVFGWDHPDRRIVAAVWVRQVDFQEDENAGPYR